MMGRVLMFTSLAFLGTAHRISAQVADDKVYTFVLFDELEYQQDGETNPIHWDAEGWIGGDFEKLWFKTEGEQLTSNGEGEGELQVLYSRLFSGFWDLQVGLRLDGRYGGDVDHWRGLVAFGFEGLAPYWFQVEAATFISHNGDVSFRASVTYDMFLGQRLVAQPRIEVNVAVQEVPEFGIGSGLNDFELGWRLRYEIEREFAPYVGVSWIRRVGGTADMARDIGLNAGDLSLVGGVRVWF